MTSNTKAVRVPAKLLAEVHQLLEYGLTKNCDTSAALRSSLHSVSRDYACWAAVPVPTELLTRIHRALLVLCISAGTDFAPGENVVRFTRAADQIRNLLPNDTNGHLKVAGSASPPPERSNAQ